MKNALLTSGIAASLLSLSFATPSLQDPARPLRAVEPGDRARQDDARMRKEANVEKRTMRQVGDAYRSLRKASLDVLRAYANDWGADAAQPNDIVAHRREAIERRGDTVADAPTTPPPATHPGYALQGEELLIAACTDGLLAGAPIYGAHAQPAPTVPGDGSAKDPAEDGSKDGRSSEGRGKKDKDDSKGSDDDRNERSVRDRLQDLGDHTSGRTTEGAPEMSATAKDKKDKDKKDKSERPATDLQRGETVGMLLVCAYGDDASAPEPGRRVQNEKDMSGNPPSARDASSRVERPVPAGSQLQPGVFAVHRAGDAVWLTDEAGTVVLRTSIQSKGVQGNSDLSETEAERQRIRNQIASSSFADGGEDWELVFGAITKEAMTSMGWAKGERVSMLRR